MVRRVRGSTIIECLLTIGLSVSIFGAVTLLYAHTATRTMDALAMTDTAHQLQDLSAEINSVVANAILCEKVTFTSGRSALRCRMPANRGPKNVRGFYDTYSPSYIHPRLFESYEPGEYVWIYTANSTGTIDTVGTGTYLARTTTTVNPTTGQIDWDWTFQDGTAKKLPRYRGQITLAFAVVPAQRIVQSTVSLAVGNGTGQSFGTGARTSYRDLSVVNARIWRQDRP